jgi:SsrA-binding protein
MRERVVYLNKKAQRDYEILETYEAGIELKGPEVKSLRNGATNLQDSFARIVNGEIFLLNWYISPYEYGNRYNPEPTRPKKLLLHKREILRLYGKAKEKGFALIPLKIYFKGGKAKCELAVAKGKRQYDRREKIRQKIAKREIERALRGRLK